MTTHSNGGKTWLTKLNRIGILARAEQSTIFNNLGHIIDMPMLLDCFNCLDSKKAVGVDGITKEIYEGDLVANLTELLFRIRRGTYRPQASRIVEIPKEDGSMRKLAIACFEDKIVQLSISRVLETIFEPTFLPCSFGYRLGRNAHDALRELHGRMIRNGIGAIVEIDIQKYFDRIPHEHLLKFLKEKISDRRFLGLIVKLMRAPVQDDKTGKITNTIGVPQGSIVSPILSNIYLHNVIDKWVDALSREHFKGRCNTVRFADDMVFIFESQSEAKSLYYTLPKRLEKFGLTMSKEKSSIQVSGYKVVKQLQDEGKLLPKFKFLGFEVSWTISQKGRFRPVTRPRRDRMRAKLKSIKCFLKKNLNAPNHMEVLKRLAAVMRGWINYFAVSDCGPRVKDFIDRIRIMIHRWFNRRGKRGCMNWSKLSTILQAAGVPNRFHLTRLYHSVPKTIQPEIGSVMP